MIGGKYRCDVIPLHSTVNQIACKTRSAMTGTDWGTFDGRNTFPVGDTGDLNVTVIADGTRKSTCASSKVTDCQFRFMHAWYHSPRLHRVSPAAVTAGELITVTGFWMNTPFNFEEIRAPSQEIPLVSVKVANRPGALQNAANEPFGASGTRCLLFDPATEEPYGIEPDDNNPVRLFKCSVGPAPEANRYNLSVALLGRGRIPDSEMNMGESMVAREASTADHEGVTFMLSHLAVVERIVPSTSGISGGDKLTIHGQGFPNEPSRASLSIAGVPCTITMSSYKAMECTLGTWNESASLPVGQDQPGGRGVHMRIWHGIGNKFNWDSKSPWPLAELVQANISTQLVDFVEAPSDMQNDVKTEFGPVGSFKGFFRAPKTSNYTFIVAADDGGQVYVGRNESTAALEIKWGSWLQHRDYTFNLDFCRMCYHVWVSAIGPGRNHHLAPCLDLLSGGAMQVAAMPASWLGGQALQRYSSPVAAVAVSHGISKALIDLELSAE